jgi:hypothetical protein
VIQVPWLSLPKNSLAIGSKGLEIKLRSFFFNDLSPITLFVELLLVPKVAWQIGMKDLTSSLGSFLFLM